MKVIYISDSLGTPIHPRGIFNYSIALVEILKAAGASVDLVVEGAGAFSLEGRYGSFTKSAPDAVNSVRLSELHRYFNEGKLSFRWGFRRALMRELAKLARPVRWGWSELRERARLRTLLVVRNDVSQIDFVPPKSEHLTLFDRLIVKKGFYSRSMTSANLDLPPVAIDVAGYDLAIVDTPHYVQVSGLPAKRILTVVHDLIPLRDPTMDALWRNLFLRKLEATLALGANLVFVSRYTQRVFRSAFPRHSAPSEFIFPPAIRRKLMADAEALTHNDVAAPRFAFGAERAFASADGEGKKKGGKKGGRDRELKAALARFDPTLPYFVTATSDEPRKNIAVIARAFTEFLQGRANAIVLGDVDWRRYSTGGPGNVFFAGYVSDAEKAAYFSRARGVVFASLSEGFGIPIVEGAVMGLPVVCSDIEVFREVAGDDAFYFDPYDPASLARAVGVLLDDEAFARARAAALRRSVLARFSQEAVGESVRSALSNLGVGTLQALSS